MGEKVYITGINGFLGRTLAGKLLEAGCEVCGLRLLQDDRDLLTEVPYYTGDVSRLHTLVPFMKAAARDDAVLIHCAGLVSITSDHPALWRVNVDGTRNVTDLCERYGIRKFIYVSSVHAIPEKTGGRTIKETSRFSASYVKGTYGKSKAEAAAYVKKAASRGLPATIVHPSGMIGPKDSTASYMTQLIRLYVKHGMPLSVKGGYDFVDVRDVADGIIRCMRAEAAGESYILSNEYVTIREIFDILAELTGKHAVYGSLPLGMARAAAPFCEKFSHLFGLPELVTPYSVYTLGSNGNFSHEKATRELGYHPRPLRETLEDMVQWFSANDF